MKLNSYKKFIKKTYTFGTQYYAIQLDQFGIAINTFGANGVLLIKNHNKELPTIQYTVLDNATSITANCQEHVEITRKEFKAAFNQAILGYKNFLNSKTITPIPTLESIDDVNI